MARTASILAISLILSCAPPATESVGRFGLVIHGGAGAITPERVSAERREATTEKLTEALNAGHAILKDGGTSLDAVEHVITLLEDSPLFNAGKGAVFTAEGTNELDASIMDGRDLSAGAVAAVKRVKNPIQLARLVMEDSTHVLLASDGADVFAQEQGVELVEPEYFFTQRRWDALQRRRQQEEGTKEEPSEDHGTVGAVALDTHGNLAAGTSTGGRTYKRFGRIGDSPIVGAGTYADNRTCAVSCTGHGEYFIRIAVAHDISALMAYRRLTVHQATADVMAKVGEMGGTGGLIALDASGNLAMPFNTDGMYRGFVNADGEVVVRMFGE